MGSKQPGPSSEGQRETGASGEQSQPPDGTSGVEPSLGHAATEAGSNDSAFDRLMHEAARVSSPGRLLSTGTRLCDGRFRIQRRLGEGGMGVVFEAFDTQSGKPVAIKTLSRVDAAGIYRMKREFRSLAGVAHPYLVPLHELFADDDLWFFTMDLVDGAPFARYLRPHGDPPDEGSLRGVLSQLVAGVQALHDAGKLHRDLKPSNVLVADGPRVAILDFGLASEAAAPGATQTIERGVAGTPAYMAPEQARGQHATPASDWYAVGVMLFEVLTGRLPFTGDALALLLDKQTKAAPAVRSLAPEAPADLAELCDRLLAKAADVRPEPAEIFRITGAVVGTSNASVPPNAQSSRKTTGSSGDEPEAPNPELAETFVGRAREIGQLETALADTNEGKPVFVRISGPSGIGKTTFVEHFLHGARTRGDVVVLRGRCYQRESVPFKGFDGVVDALSRHLLRLPEAEALRLVPRHAAALARVFPVLGRVDAITSAPQRRGLPSEGVELRYRAFEALKELLAKLAEERPLVLSIDDLQWSDRDSARLLKHLLTPPDPPMLLLVATHRDDEPDAEGLRSVREELTEDASGRDVDVRTIELGALSPTESRRLAQQLLTAAAREQVERIAREAAGSPFLIGELTRAAHHDDQPVDLRAAILRRVAELPPETRAVLEVLCVAPRPVAPELVARVVDADVAPELRTLLAGRLGREVAVAGSASAKRRQHVAAYHDRIRETVLDAMPPDARVRWHGRYAEVLEASEPLDLDALVDHTLGAGDSEKAGTYARRAAREAVMALAFDRAVSLYQTALEHSKLTAPERAEVLIELAEAHTGAGRGGDAARAFLEAADLDPSRTQELQRRAGERFFINGDLDAGANAMRRALGSAGLDYDALVRREAIFPSYQALLERGFAFERRDPASIDAAQRARLDTLYAAAVGIAWLVVDAVALPIAYVREALDAGDAGHVAMARAVLFVSFESIVDPMGAGARLAELLALLEELDTPAARAWAALCKGNSAFWQGQEDLGLAELVRAEELFSAADTAGMQRELTVSRIMVTNAKFLEGRNAFVEYAFRFLRLADETGDRLGRVWLRCALYIWLFGQESPERIRAEIELGLELCGTLPTPQRGYGLLSLVLLDALEGRFEEVLERSEQALRAAGPGRNWMKLHWRFWRSCALLQAGRQTTDREALLDCVERDAAMLSRPLSPFGVPVDYPILHGYGDLLLGHVAAARGDRERARAHFEAGANQTGNVANAHVNRLLLGDAIGGPRGAGLRAEAERELAARGHPEWIRFCTPRFED